MEKNKIAMKKLFSYLVSYPRTSYLVLLWVALLCSIDGYAQGNFTDSINAVKRDTSYIYAESTMRDAVEAQSGARALLELKMTEWLRRCYPRLDVDRLVAKAAETCHSMVTQRGSYTRVFVYVRKNDLVPASQFNPNLTPSASNPTTPSLQIPNSLLLTPIEQQMLNCQDFSSIEPFVKGLRTQKRLKAYGKFASLPEDVPCYIFVYNRESEIVAYLRQTADGKHFNLRSLKEDNVRKYINCGAIWFQLKD